MRRLRPEHPSDRVEVDALHRLAFPSDTEAELVSALRDSGDLFVSVVADDGQQVVGHAAFSPVTVSGGEAGAVALGPVAVRPERQSQGIGTALIRFGLERCRDLGAEVCVVLGEPEYYTRFGFRRAAEFGLGNEYGVDEPFMALELLPRSLADVAGVVRYCDAFRDL